MEGRIPVMRQRVGKRRPASPIVFGFIVLFFVGVLIVLFLRSPLSIVTKIQVTGNHLLSREEVLHTAEIAEGDSYFGFSSGGVQDALASLPEVKQVEVEKVFPNQVYIRIQEHTVTAVYRTPQYQFLPVLEDGSVLTQRPLSSGSTSYPVFTGWAIKNPTFIEASKQMALVPVKIRSQLVIVQPIAQEKDQVEILTQEHHVIFVRASELGTKLKLYAQFLKKPPGTLNLLNSIWFVPNK